MLYPFCPKETSVISKIKICNGLCLVVLVGLLSACGSKQSDNQALVPDSDPTALGQAESLESPAIGIMEGRTTGPMLPVYFGFDSYSINGDQVSRMQVNADYMKDKGEVRVRIEGNCDPRGTREYNLALGERRALGAKRYLVHLGIDSERISTVSLGEEKLLLQGTNQKEMARNRRDDFVVK